MAKTGRKINRKAAPKTKNITPKISGADREWLRDMMTRALDAFSDELRVVRKPKRGKEA